MSMFSQIAEALSKALGERDRAKHQGASEAPAGIPPDSTSRQPYTFNIGMDFGTAFTKCVVRDVRRDRAFPVSFFHKGTVEDFLFPSEVFRVGNLVKTAPLSALDIDGGATLYLKMALYATVRGKRHDAWLEGVTRVWPEDEEEQTVETLVIVFLAEPIRVCLNEIRKQLPDFGRHPDDLCSVNMAVPVAHAQYLRVEEAFERCLLHAWRLAQEPQPQPLSLGEWREKIADLKFTDSDVSACFIYPEVSASVQSFVQSRAGRRGFYMFVDVGAGTVDASLFLYPGAPAPISYFSADVVPLGSSQLEIRAAATIARDAEMKLRQIKEGFGIKDEIKLRLRSALQVEANAMEAELLGALEATAGQAQLKLSDLERRHDWPRVRVLMGGGGCMRPEYQRAAKQCFSTWGIDPAVAPLPEPSDIDWPKGFTDQIVAFRRLAVAYGLSFARENLQGHRYPAEVTRIEYEGEGIEPVSSPSKDEV